MSLATRIQELAVRAAGEIKSIRTLLNGNAADNSALTTTAKNNLVAAINEVQAAVQAAASSGGAAIDDAAVTTTTAYSSSKIVALIDAVTAADVGAATQADVDAAVSALVDASPATLDTLNELAAALGDDPNFAATMTTALGNRLRVDAVQTLTAPQKAQGQANLGVVDSTAIGDTDRDFVTLDFDPTLV
jgi:hypothetical protein